MYCKNVGNNIQFLAKKCRFVVSEFVKLCDEFDEYCENLGFVVSELAAGSRE